MKLVAPKRIALRPVRPHPGVEAKYRRQLQALIESMHKSVLHWLLQAYEKQVPDSLTQDAKVPDLQKTMNRLAARWRSEFAQVAPDYAKELTRLNLDRSDAAFRTQLNKHGFSVKFQSTPKIQAAVDQRVRENVELIKSIPTKYMEQVQDLVSESVLKGRKMDVLTKRLQNRLDVTKDRAALIARDQNNKATALFQKLRQLQVGITKAIWAHSVASAHPRQEHIDFDGQIYDVEEGMYSEEDGENVWPGTPINCGCTSRPFIPGYDDVDESEEEGAEVPEGEHE